MSREFKVGDKVMRVYADGRYNVFKGEIYIVSKVLTEYITLKGKGSRTYAIGFFALWEEDDFPKILKRAKEIRRLGDKILNI